MKYRALTVIIGLILGSLIAFAQDTSAIQITDINHFPASDLEWIEITNNSTEILDVEKIKIIVDEIKYDITHPTQTQIEAGKEFIITNKGDLLTQITGEQFFESLWETNTINHQNISIEYNNTLYDQKFYPTTSTLSFLALITEISPNSDKDFIELYFVPAPGTELNLKDWQLFDDNTLYTFSEQIISTPTYITIETPLTKTNENVNLIDPLGNIIDAACWHSTDPSQAELADKDDLINSNQWSNDCISSEQIATKTSIGRTSFFDTNTASDWAHFSHSTPNSTNEHKNSTPTAILNIQSGTALALEKTSINLTGENSTDPDNDQLSYSWFLNGDLWNEKANPAELEITEIGTHKIELIVSDPSGATSSSSLYIQIEPKPEPIITPSCSPPAQTSSTPTSTNTTATTSPTPTPDTSWWSLITIHSFLANPKGNDSGNEWIKLINNSNQTVDLTNWQLDDQEGGSKPFKISNLIIAPNQTVTISNTDSRIGLNNSNDEVRLFTPDGQLAASISYDKANEDQVLPETDIKTAATITDTPQLTPVQTKIITQTATKTNSQIAPKSKNGTNSTELKITEIFPNPKGTDQNQEWLELHNPTANPINLGNWKLKVNSKEYTFNDKVIIPPNSYSKLTQADLNFILTNSETTVQLLNFNNELSSQVEYTKTQENKSFSILNATTWEWTPHLTPGQSNPKLIQISGTINPQLLNQNQILIQSENTQNIVQFSTDQISSEQLQLLQNQHQITLTALNANNILYLKEINSLTPIPNKSSKPNLLPPLIISLLPLLLLIYKPSRSWLLNKLNLAKAV